MQGLAQGQGVCVTYYPSGPLFEYMPDRVAAPPKTAEELIAYAGRTRTVSSMRAPRIPARAELC